MDAWQADAKAVSAAVAPQSVAANTELDSAKFSPLFSRFL
jgi:hypothetical protein